MAAEAAHSENHAGEPRHHHHTHAPSSRHVAGHHLLQVEHLVVEFSGASGVSGASRAHTCGCTRPIDGLSVSVHVGEIVAVVGASGAGKSLLADVLFGLYEKDAFVSGTVFFDGVEQTPQSLRALRGREIALVPQGVSALDPLMRVGVQIGGDEATRAALLERYRLDRAVERMYPFELSGGMARRVLLASALAAGPRLIVADEPTSGLDLELAVRAADDFRAFADCGGGVLFITHDIELALRVADRIAVFLDGAVVEETSVEGFSSPEALAHPFSRRLWHALPGHGFRDAGEDGEPPQADEGERGGMPLPAACSGGDVFSADAPEGESSAAPAATGGGEGGRSVCAQTARGKGGAGVLRADKLSFSWNPDAGAGVVRDFSLELKSGERVTLAGPSGCGKSTVCQLLAGYLRPDAGSVLLNGAPFSPRPGVPNPVQLVWQHPEQALDPNLRLRASIEEGGHVPEELRERLGIKPEWFLRRPHELSGGQLQRCCIARALAVNPRFLIADEISTMLDAVTQQQVWSFLLGYCACHGVGLVLVTHSDALRERVATRTLFLGQAG